MRLLLTLADGEEIEYKMEKDSVSIGRSSQCDLVISHESMSRQHCKIEFKDHEIFITDLGSINGVYIDGKKIPANSSIPFHTYLHLAFGYVTSAQLMMDDNTRLGVINPHAPSMKVSGGPSTTSSRPVNLEAKTKTRTAQASRVMSSDPKQKPSKGSSKNSLIINALAFFGIIAALYYFLYANDGSQTPSEASPESKTSLKPVDSSDHF